MAAARSDFVSQAARGRGKVDASYWLSLPNREPRHCATQDDVRRAFRFAFQNIKERDAVVVGMYPKDLDQIALNVAYTREAIQGLGAPFAAAAV